MGLKGGEGGQRQHGTRCVTAPCHRKSGVGEGGPPPLATRATLRRTVWAELWWQPPCAHRRVLLWPQGHPGAQ